MTADEDAKAHNENLGQIASAAESLFKHQGWEIFMALFEKRKKEIYARSDYETLADFKGDRKAIEVVEGIIEEMEGFIEDATAAANLLAEGQEQPSRGVMMIDALQGDNREA